MPNFLDEDRDRIKELGRAHRHFTRLNLQTDSIVAVGALYALARRGLVPPLEKPTRTLVEKFSAREIRHDDSRFGKLLTAWLEEPLSSLNIENLKELLNQFRIQKAFQSYGKEPLFAGWLYQFGILNDVSEKSYGLRRTGRRMDELAAITRWYTPSAIAEFIVDEALGEPNKNGSGRFIDPACGAGHLLIPAFQKMLKAGENPIDLLEERLFGLDIDRRAVQMAGFAIYLACRDAGLDSDLPIPKLFWFNTDSSKSTEQDAALGSFLLGIPEEKRPGAIALSDLENEILPLDAIPSSYSHLAANPPYLSNR
ncbi:MAG TPA: N-6 DNA methylase, partial [Candidatus Melainabacteria bacterium]|nr:N-6 DNA methylase [Candidatus Melainabacteria bacterium]